MTVEWFDLGQRLHAAATGRPAARLLHAPVVAVAHPVAVRATRRRGAGIADVAVEIATPGGGCDRATGVEGLDLLGAAGVTVTSAVPSTLLHDSPGTLDELLRLAHAAPPGSDRDDVAAHIAWWHDRRDFPGGRAVVDLVSVCRTRWALGVEPVAEEIARTWRAWTGVEDDSASGVLDLHERVTAGDPLPHLDVLAEDDLHAWAAARSQHGDGWDWRRQDTASRAALGLRARCDAADLYSAALLSDPLFRRRALHTGHVVQGIWTTTSLRPRRAAVSAARLDARLRPGNAVAGWVGGPDSNAEAGFTGTVAEASVEHGRLTLALTGIGGVPVDSGQPVTLIPAPPDVYQQRRGRRTYRALYADRRSWLTTGRRPTVSRRDVPLAVLVAAAHD